MLANVIAFVPRILLDKRFDGAVMSLLAALPISLVLMGLMIRSMQAFPQRGLPEILQDYLSPWLVHIFMGFFGIMWYAAGAVTLYYFADVSVRFINPEMSTVQTMFLYCTVLVFLIQLQSRKVLYLLEILIILQVPFILFIMVKASFNQYVLWDSMLEAATYIFHPPHIVALSAATYMFTGYLNIVVFNRVFEKPASMRLLWIVGPVGMLNLLTTYFIPIGMHGMDSVGELVYKWFTTADAIRLQYGFVERLIFVFLLLYLTISLLSTLVHWHVSLQMFKSWFFVDSNKSKKSKKLSWYFAAVFGAGGIALAYWMNEQTMLTVSIWFLVLRLASEMTIVFFLYYLSVRERRKAAA